MPSLTTWGGAALWSASAVKMAQYVYQAFQSTYSQFPSPTDAGAPKVGALNLNSTAVGQHAGYSVVSKIPVVGGALSTAAQFVGSLFTPGPQVPQSVIAKLEKLNPPPAALVQKILQANKTNSPLLPKYVTQLAAWANKQGWTNQEFTGYLGYLGVKVFGNTSGGQS